MLFALKPNLLPTERTTMGQIDMWFIVQTNPNCERKAVSELRRAGFRAHMPRLARVRRHHRTGEPLIKRRPLLVGYVFMRFPGPVNWYALRQCQGVKGVLYLDGRAYQMPREHVAVIMRASGQWCMKMERPGTYAGRCAKAVQTCGQRSGRPSLGVCSPGAT